MINRLSKKFVYNKANENLFLFFQKANEALFDYSPDSYKAPILDSRFLCEEAYYTYNALVGTRSVDKYYKRYITPIVQEILESLSKDKIAKNLLEKRYSIIEGNLRQAISNQKQFESTIRNLLNYLGGKKYYYEVVKSLSLLIKKGEKNQEDIIRLTEIWICELCNLGYAKQHIYNVINYFFREQEITSAIVIDEFFGKFDFKIKKWELLTIIDKKMVPYINGLQNVLKSSTIHIERFGMSKLKELVLQTDYKKMNWFLNNFQALQRLESVECEKLICYGYDPYIAMEKVQNYIKTLSNFITNFDNEDKKLYSYNVCLNYMKQRIVVQSAMNRRTRVYSQDYLPNTVKLLKNLTVSKDVLSKILKVLEYHGDAVSEGIANKYVVSMLWTSLETLFVDGNISGSKGDLVEDGLIEIIQRTYIVKRLKYLQNDFVQNIKSYKPELIAEYKLEDLNCFIEMLFDFPDSERTKQIQATLEKNPLLRSRVYSLVVKDLGTAKRIKNFLDNHKKKIQYQIERIYRVRNFLIHASKNMPYEESIVECLHYYVDFVINYIFAKTEAGDSIYAIRDLVIEARDDNIVHENMLKEYGEEKTTIENYMEFLFGPSSNVLSYYMEHIV